MCYHFGTGGFPSEGVLTSFGRSRNSICRAKNPGNRCFQLKWQSKVSVKCFIKNNLTNSLRYESEFMRIFLNKWMLYRPKWFWQKNRKSDLMNYILAKVIQPQMDIFFKKSTLPVFMVWMSECMSSLSVCLWQWWEPLDRHRRWIEAY